MRDTSRLRRRKTKPQIIERERLVGLREQLRQWLAGEEIPGTPAYTHGPKRDQFVVDVADLILGSGVRPGEALAASWDQFDLEAEPATFTVNATVVRLKGKGLFRQEWTKTDAGHRTVTLPGFVVDMLKRLQDDPKHGRMWEVRALREVRAEVVGTLLASASFDGTVRLWDPHTGQPFGKPLAGRSRSVIDVAFSPDSTFLAAALGDNTLRIWTADHLW
ncbi:hypothetical protein IU459_18180 [Nocardia amamiensis]|uniref:WD40 repeat domain-containing protein n=1 Tax=Nocardia amamiensis TaxID=404578 RepID=A0ABS0CS58_9NOCA|nr:hypothetical protein [Nocardia amamiensis]MBF6299455.1 hypothetical protein [Nocardia amamiensis]